MLQVPPGTSNCPIWTCVTKATGCCSRGWRSDFCTPGARLRKNRDERRGVGLYRYDTNSTASFGLNSGAFGFFRQALRRHWDVIAATDFFTVEVWTLGGLVRYHVLFVIKLATRKVEIAGIVPEPNGIWMKQIARNLTDCVDGFLIGYEHLIHDRGTQFTKEFRSILGSAGVKSLRLPPRSPNLNAWFFRDFRGIFNWAKTGSRP